MAPRGFAVPAVVLLGLVTGVVSVIMVLVPGNPQVTTRGEQDQRIRVRPPSPSPPAAAARSRPTPPQPVRAPRDPVLTSNFPDPEVIKIRSVYYAYATNDDGRRMPVATAPAVAGPWTRLDVEGLASVGPWAEDGRTWAPDVSPRGDGTLLLYYTARRRGTDLQCIGVAVSASPTGPFQPVGDAPLVCPEKEGGAIDPAAFVDTDGTRYLLYKSEGHPSKRPSVLCLQRMKPDGLSLDGPPIRILTWDKRTEPSLIEAPALVRRDGRYVLFYAGGVFYNDSYQTGYATADKITGPYKRAGGPLLSTDGYDEKVRGPGGADVFTDENGDHLVFHGILEDTGKDQVRRGMYVADLGWADGRPVATGVPVRYEAEDAKVNQAKVVDDRPLASGTKAVGRLDYADSWVEFRVFAPSAGTYTVRVSYANHSKETASQELTVDGVAQSTIDYPVTRGKGWPTRTVQADLRPGWNTLRLRHLDGYTEIDHIEVS